MAAKKTSNRNSDRPGCGKAWAKNHGQSAKPVSPEKQARRDAKAAKRAKRPAQEHPGSRYTMPDFDWTWATETVQGRHENTKRSRVVRLCIAEAIGKEPVLAAEIKTPKSRKEKVNA